MDVAVSEFRAHLSEWLARAQQGDEIVVTDRGTPVARVVGIGRSSTLDQLTEQGVISRPSAAGRPAAAGAKRPRSKRPVASRVSEQRG
ncbi:MAG: type II toxin-antitoxin system prevent-host-death family antitoxin [Acidimicrobiales bacterium]